MGSAGKTAARCRQGVGTIRARHRHSAGKAWAQCERGISTAQARRGRVRSNEPSLNSPTSFSPRPTQQMSSAVAVHHPGFHVPDTSVYRRQAAHSDKHTARFVYSAVTFRIPMPHGSSCSSPSHWLQNSRNTISPRPSSSSCPAFLAGKSDF